MATRTRQSASPRARALLKSFELGPSGDFSPTPYDDGGGVLTIGFGHRIRPGESFTQPLDRTGAERVFLEDVRNAEVAVDRLNLVLSQNEFDALALWAFNLGGEALARSTLARRLRDDPRYPEAIEKQWMRWVHQGQQRLDGLVIRRSCEWMLFRGAPDSAIADERARLQILAARGKL